MELQSLNLGRTFLLIKDNYLILHWDSSWWRNSSWDENQGSAPSPPRPAPRHVSALRYAAEHDDSPELAVVTNAAFKISTKVH